MKQQKRTKVISSLWLLLYAFYISAFFYMLPQRIKEKEMLGIFTGIVIILCFIPMAFANLRKLRGK